MDTNASITIYNRYPDRENKRFLWFRTELPDIHWYTDQKVNTGERGLVSADLIKIRIPDTAGYLPPEEYAALSLEDAKKHWTTRNGDLFVKGIVKTEIEKESDLMADLKGEILSYSDNRRGLNPHIRIRGGTSGN